MSITSASGLSIELTRCCDPGGDGSARRFARRQRRPRDDQALIAGVAKGQRGKKEGGHEGL